MLFRAAQAQALLRGRKFVTPDDVRDLAPAVLGHRFSIDGASRYAGIDAKTVLAEILQRLPVPS